MTTPTFYVPKIEEFCIGFLYEYKWDSWNGYFEKTDEWIKEEFCGAGGGQLDEETEIDCIEECIEKGMLRVKHLDREDIEGEGWEYKENGNVKYFDLNDENRTALNVLGDNQIRIDDHYGIIGATFTILNLTEFRKLMKQLGIKK